MDVTSLAFLGRAYRRALDAGDRLMLFDVKTQKWTELAKINVAWPEWSREGDYIYFPGVSVGSQQGLFRVRMAIASWSRWSA